MRAKTVKDAAILLGKSERSVWRYVHALERSGKLVSYRLHGDPLTYVDLDVLEPYAATQQRGNPRHREMRAARREGACE